MMHYFDNFGWGAFGWVFMLIFWGLIIWAIIAIIRAVTRPRDGRDFPSNEDRRDRSYDYRGKEYFNRKDENARQNLSRKGGARTYGTPGDYYAEDHVSDDSALKILRERYAKGEISKDEFNRLKRDLA